MNRSEFPTMMVFDDHEKSAVPRIVINTDVGGKYPVLCVLQEHEADFLAEENFSTVQYRFCSPITEQPDNSGFCHCAECAEIRRNMDI